MRQPNTELVFCVNCGRVFERYFKKKNPNSYRRNVRKFNCVTCTNICSKEWNRKRMIMAANNARIAQRVSKW
jgi:tRNA A37 threonylcarbamoyladenosine synthetase subunit TsaC/SUA5/YrdC